MVKFARDKELGYFMETISSYEEYKRVLMVLKASGCWPDSSSHIAPSGLPRVVAVLRLAGLTVEVEE